jgi:predicted RNA-binding Zn ribbon-like protein
METRVGPSGPFRALPVVGGHLALDFANTVDDPEGKARCDHIATYPELVAWGHRIGVLGGAQADALVRAGARHPRKARAALARTHALRTVLQNTFTAVATDAYSAVEDWAELRPFVAAALARSELIDAGTTFELTWPLTDDLDAIVAPVATSAAQLLQSADLSRVKRCAGCPWLFVDKSKNGSRRWCAMDDCGRHEKIRRYVDRRRQARTRS